jgi:DNA uptake protein ComE-like DNA-binding protein
VSRGRAGAARAALALAAGLGAAELAPGTAPAPCAAHAERVAEAGRTVEVACAPGGAFRPVRGPARLVLGRRIDPNSADAETLEALPSIGPARAESLLRERARTPFCSARDLDRVKGIGPKLRAAIEPWLEFGPAAGCPAGG